MILQGTTDYYTMSSQGVTHFLQDSTDFQPLESFERDYFLYAQTMRLRLFRQFRIWKSFKVRRRSPICLSTVLMSALQSTALARLSMPDPQSWPLKVQHCRTVLPLAA